jgi:hypothetical protein
MDDTDSVFPGPITLAVIAQVLLTAYSGVVYLGAGTTVIGAGDAASLGIVGLGVATIYAVSAVQTSRRRWPTLTSVTTAIASAAWMIVLAQKYDSSDRILAGIGALLAAMVTASAFVRASSRKSLWRVHQPD